MAIATGDKVNYLAENGKYVSGTVLEVYEDGKYYRCRCNLTADDQRAIGVAAYALLEGNNIIRVETDEAKPKAKRKKKVTKKVARKVTKKKT